jgi:tetratricopeptide (TPR) repeat protein
MDVSRVLGAVCLAFLFAGCSNIPFGGQEFSYRHDQAADRLLIFQHYQHLGGDVHGSFQARIEGLANGTLTYGFSADRGSLFSGSYHFEPALLADYLTEVRGDDALGRKGWAQSLVPEQGGTSKRDPDEIEDEIDQAVREEEQEQYLRKQQIAFLEQVLESVVIGPATFYVNEWGQLCAYQPVIVNEFSTLVQRANQLLDRWVSSPANRFITEADRPVVERFARKRDWIQVTGNQIKVQFPISLAAADEAAMAEDDRVSLVLLTMFHWEVFGDRLPDAGFLHYDEPIMGLTVGAKTADAVHLQSDDFDSETLADPELIGYAGQRYGLATDPTVAPEAEDSDEDAEPEERPTPLDEIRDDFLVTGKAPPAFVVTPDDRSAQTAELLARLAVRYAKSGQDESDIAKRERSFEEATKAAEASLKLDDSSAMAYSALAASRVYGAWDAAGAESALRQVVELDPEDADARHMLAWVRGARGQFKTAIQGYRGLLAEDLGDQKIGGQSPGYAHLWSELAAYLAYSGRHDEAVEAAEAMLEAAREADQLVKLREAEHALSVGYRHLAQSRPTDAIKALDCEARGQYLGVAACAIAYHRAGQTDKAWGSLSRLMVVANSMAATEVAMVLMQWGQPETAFWWLERAYESRDGTLWLLKVHPWFEPIRDDPRYVELLERMGLTGELPGGNRGQRQVFEIGVRDRFLAVAR